MAVHTGPACVHWLKFILAFSAHCELGSNNSHYSRVEASAGRVLGAKALTGATFVCLKPSRWQPSREKFVGSLETFCGPYVPFQLPRIQGLEAGLGLHGSASSLLLCLLITYHTRESGCGGHRGRPQVPLCALHPFHPPARVTAGALPFKYQSAYMCIFPL